MTTTAQNTLLVAFSGNVDNQSCLALDLTSCMDRVLEQIAQTAATFGAVSHAVTCLDSDIDTEWHNTLIRGGKAWKTTAIASSNIDDCTSIRIKAALNAGAMFLTFPDEDNAHMRDEAIAVFSDMLVVVWDGDNTGDTARLIRHFLLLRKPVVWLEHGSDKTSIRCCLLKHLDHSVLASLEWGDIPIDHLFNEGEGGLVAILPKWLSHLALDKPLVSFEPENFGGFIDRRYGWWDKLFRCVFEPESRRALAKLITLKPLTAAFRGKAFEISPDLSELSVAFDKADVTAGQCAGKYRSTSVLAYLLSALAIISAILGILTHAAVWAWLEIITICVILLLIGRAKKNNVHEHFIKSRMEAELIRYHRLLLPVLGVTQVLNSPFFDVEDNGAIKLVFPEMLYLRRLLANVFHTETLLSPGKKNCDLKMYLQYLKEVVNEQASYHKSRHLRENSLHHRLHSATQSVFFLTLVAVALHVVDVTLGLHWQFGYLLSALAIGMPAVAAALHGILVQSDAGRVAHLSERMMSLLKRHGKRLDDVSLLLDAAKDETSYGHNLDIVRRNAVEIANLMINEALEWRSGIELREPSLPA